MGKRGVLIAAVFALKLVSGQQPGASPVPAFAVASIKPTDLSLNRQIDMKVLPGGTVTATAVTLKFLITVAYNVQNVEISGGPAWLDTDRFDIVAKPPEAKPPDGPSFRAMLQSLLEDRFRLMVRRETREQSVYEIAVNKPGQLGPNLKPSELGECPTQPGTRATTPCGGFLLLDGKLTGQRVKAAQLTSPLSRILDRPVVDKTGLDTNFDVTLEWAPDRVARPDSDSNLPSIFTAVEEQLGLKLQAAKMAMPVLVIDRAEKHSGN